MRIRKNTISMLVAALAIIFGVHATGFAQHPSDNPCAALFTSKAHWTNTIKWKNVTEANSVANLINGNNEVDSATWVTACSKIASAGGGVLYFPSGVYKVNFNLPLYDGVIVRGATGNAALKGKPEYFATRFVFPKLFINRREVPIPRNIPFTFIPKMIFAASPDANVLGLVNIDIDKASVVLDGSLRMADKKEMPVRFSEPYNVGHILLYQVRNNNAAMLDPAIPTKLQASEGQQWQIWPDRLSANFNVAFTKACVISECILNDSVSDNIIQWDYMTEDGMRVDAHQAVFRFSDHNGMNVQSIDANAKDCYIQNNNVKVSAQYIPIAVSGYGTNITNNTTARLTDDRNMVINGKLPVRTDYNLLLADKVQSESDVFVTPFGDSLKYRIIKPANYDPSKSYPLVVYLHDYWERGSDNKRHLRQFIWQLVTDENRQKFPCFIIAPQLPLSEQKWKQVNGLGSETIHINAIARLIDHCTDKYKIDSKRVYGVGHSLGGSGILNLAIHYPDKFAAVVPISTWYVLTKHASIQLTSTPLWFIYGENDERIQSRVKQSIRLDLKEAQANFKFTEIPGYSHRCWNDLNETVPDLFPWMFAQRK